MKGSDSVQANTVQCHGRWQKTGDPEVRGITDSFLLSSYSSVPQVPWGRCGATQVDAAYSEKF